MILDSSKKSDERQIFNFEFVAVWKFVYKRKIILKYTIGEIIIINNKYVLLIILLVPASAVRCVVNTADPVVNCKPWLHSGWTMALIPIR